MKPNIELHIEELVLTGVDRRDAARVTAAVQARLEALLLQHGLPPTLAAGAAIPEVRSAPARDLRPGKPDQLGANVADAVYSQINPAQK